jgi:predicted RNA-binding Zn ribbon-like protein
MPSHRSSRHSRPSADLALLIEFTNTVDLGAGTDEFANARGLRKWMSAHGVGGSRSDISKAQLDRAVTVREGLRALALANSGDDIDKTVPRAFREIAGDLVLSPIVEAGGDIRMQPRHSGVESFLARLLIAAHAAMLDGSWTRVKACRNDRCRWLFFDRSRNRSGAWCDMAACGNVMKARAYRRRVVARRHSI